MSEERLQEIKDSVNLQREILKAHNMGTLCVDEEQELIEEIERLKKREQECIDHYLVQCKYASEMEDKYITANNIINELEKDIDLELYKTRANDEYNKGLFNAFRYVKDKLEELKGSDSNEQ